MLLLCPVVPICVPLSCANTDLSAGVAGRARHTDAAAEALYDGRSLALEFDNYELSP